MNKYFFHTHQFGNLEYAWHVLEVPDSDGDAHDADRLRSIPGPKLKSNSMEEEEAPFN